VLESEFLEPWERTVKQLQLGSFINERQKPERVKARPPPAPPPRTPSSRRPPSYTPG
jgi:hypothetical protein